MITKSLDVVLSIPGIWIAVTNCLLLIEVEPDGTCHQLNMRNMERDGELTRGGWCLSPWLQFVGPMGRAGQTAGSHGGASSQSKGPL